MGVINRIFSGEGVTDLVNPAHWFTSALGGYSQAIGGQRVGVDSALSLPAYFACIRCISEDVAKLPLITYRRLKPKGKERAAEHPLYNVLHLRPNQFMTSVAFRECMVANVLSWGNAYAEILRDGGGEPSGLMPFHPQLVTAQFNDGKTEIEYIVRVVGEEPRRIDSGDMVHIHGLGGDGLAGYSVLQYASESIGLSLDGQKFSSKFLGNASRPSGALETPHKLGDPEYRRLKADWEKHHTGVENSGKPIILEQGMQWKSITIPPEEAQLIEGRQFQVEEVCRWFRMPPHKIAHLLRATYSNIEQQSLDYYIDTLLPWIVRVEQEFQIKLFEGDPEYFCEHLVTGILRGDQAARSQYYREQFMIGAISQNEIRELENMNPIENGDTYYVPLNMTRAEDAAQGNATQEQNPDPGPGDSNMGAPDDRRAEDKIRWIGAYEGIFLDAANRIIRKEAKATARAGKRYDGRPAAFKAWEEKFFSGQLDHYAEVLSPLIVAISTAFDVKVDCDRIVRQFAGEQIAISSRMVDQAFGAKAGDLEAMGEEWLKLRPQAMARKLVKEFQNAVR